MQNTIEDRFRFDVLRTFPGILVMLSLVLCKCTPNTLVPTTPPQVPTITRPISTPIPAIVSLDVAEIDEQFRSMTNQETLITMAWTFVPYPGFYYVLGIAPNGHLNTWRRSATGRQLMFQGDLSTEELAEVSSIISKMSNLQTGEVMSGTIVINVLFSIESKKYSLSFDESNVPEGLRYVYEISEIAVKRKVQEQGLGSVGHEWNPFRNSILDKKNNESLPY